MKTGYINSASRLMAVVLTVFSWSAPAAAGDRSDYVPPQPQSTLSNRLIVKFKPALWTKGLGKVRVVSELMRPLDAGTLNQLQTAAGVALSESHAISNGAHIIILQGTPDRQTVDSAIKNIRGLSDVEYAEEDRIMTVQAIPNDASYTNLWGMQPVVPAASPSPGSVGNYGADFQTAWDTNQGLSNTTGLGIIVAVVDTGITPHADIVGSGGTVSPATGNLVSPGYDFTTDCRVRNSCAATTSDSSAVVAPSADATDLGDFISLSDCQTVGSLFYVAGCTTATNSSWHGTHVAGTIAAIGNNSTGVIGGAYAARILPVRVLGEGGGYLSDIAEGIRWAANANLTIPNPNPAKVINMSLGGTGACGTTQQSAIDAAVANGAVVVVAAGNENADVANHSPANCNNVIVVAAVGRDGLRAAYSNYSSPASNTTNPVQVTIAAQGADKSLTGFDPGILSTVNSSTTIPDLNTTSGSAYAYYQGTSMATPHVSAAVALIMARNPALSPSQVKTILAQSVTAFPSSNVWALYDCATKGNCGSGILNARLAVQNSILPYSIETAVAATKGGGVNSGGCSIMPFGDPDISVLLTVLSIAAYRFRLRLSKTLAKS